MSKPNKTMYCRECGNDDIEWQVWADEHNNVSPTEPAEPEEIWCNDCETHTYCEIKPSAKEKSYEKYI